VEKGIGNVSTAFMVRPAGFQLIRRVVLFLVEYTMLCPKVLNRLATIRQLWQTLI